MPDPIISVSGLRGIFGESLHPLNAIEYTTAFARTLAQDGPIVLTRDGRVTGRCLADAISSGLTALGRDVLDGDVAATPTTGVLVQQHQAAGGIQISASHNPAPYNGIKLFGSDGRVISATAGQQVMEAYARGGFAGVSHDRVGTRKRLHETTGEHLRRVLATVDQEAIRKHHFKVVLDSHHGAGSVLGRPLLEALGCRVECLGEVPDGRFTRSPEPTEQNLAETTQAAGQFGADAVFCQDPDADRLAIIDETGTYIGEEFTLALTLQHALQRRSGPVVVNCSSSRMSADICAAHGCDYHLSAVGEANVTDKMLAVGAVYGGEGNGGPIDPRVGLVRDSFVAMAQVLDAMAATGKTISQLARELPQYAIYKTTIEITADRVPKLQEALQQRYPDASASTLDGLRLDWPDRWILVRPSNTEPIVRAIAEAQSFAQARELCETAAELAAAIS